MRGRELCGDLALDQGRVWQRRFYDFVVWKERKQVQKLRYMHGNPVACGLVLEPEQWRWSSYRHYAYGEAGVVLVNELQKAELKFAPTAVVPTLRGFRKVGQRKTPTGMFGDHIHISQLGLG